MVHLLAIAASVALATPAEATPSPDTVPTASQKALYSALSGRHLDQTCDQLATLSPTPQADLVWLAEHAEQPAWVSVRSAECVLELYAEAAAPQIAKWMTSQNTLGLAIVTVQHLDGLPLEQARPLVQAGLSGPLADQLRPRFQRLTEPELSALAKAP